MPRAGKLSVLLLSLAAAASAAAAGDAAAGSAADGDAANVVIAQSYGGRTLRLGGWLSLPPGAGPHPAVILAHGCNGVDPAGPTSAWRQMNQWARWLRGEGYATLILDSYTARGLSEICRQEEDGVEMQGRRVPRAEFNSQRAVDFYAAADYLAKLPSIKPRAIGLLGDSNGGASTLSAAAQSNAATAAARAALAADGGAVSAFVSPYPGCRPDTIRSLFFGPVLILMGAADDWTPARACRRLARWPRPSGGQATLQLYPGATHAFDVDVPPRVTPRGHSLRYDRDATADARERIRGFFGRYLK